MSGIPKLVECGIKKSLSRYDHLFDLEHLKISAGLYGRRFFLMAMFRVPIGSQEFLEETSSLIFHCFRTGYYGMGLVRYYSLDTCATIWFLLYLQLNGFLFNVQAFEMRRDVFQAIADPVRRRILEIIASDNLTAGQVAEHFEISRQAISKQLRVLSECGLLDSEQKGRERYYRVRPESLIPASLWMEQLQQQWTDRIDSFENYLIQLKAKEDNEQQ